MTSLQSHSDYLRSVAQTLVDADIHDMVIGVTRDHRMRISVWTAAIDLRWDAKNGWTYRSYHAGGGEIGSGEVEVDPGAPAEDVVAAVIPILNQARQAVAS